MNAREGEPVHGAAADAQWKLESLARKFGVEDKAVFARLRKRICTFSNERTALANGVNGKRF